MLGSTPAVLTVPEILSPSLHIGPYESGCNFRWRLTKRTLLNISRFKSDLLQKEKRIFRERKEQCFAYLIWKRVFHNLSWRFATFWIQHRCCRESAGQLLTQVLQHLTTQPIAEQWKDIPEIPWSVNSGSDRFVSFSSSDSFALIPTATVTSKNDILSCFPYNPAWAIMFWTGKMIVVHSHTNCMYRSRW